MRTMLKTQLDVDAANLAIADGSIGKTFDKLFGYCRPEATYFLVEQGKRTVYAVFDLASPDQIPVIAETLFQAFGATVDLHPVMGGGDLETGLGAWMASR
jgi:hypothetical protein